MEGAPVLEVVDSPLDAEDAIRADQPLPEALPVLPLRDTVTFPETLTPLAVGQERSIKLVDDVLGGNRMLVMVASRDPEDEEPGPDDLYDVGVVGVVARMIKVPDGSLRDPRPGDAAGPARRLRLRAALPGGADRRAARRDQAQRRARGADPQRPAHLLGDRRADPLPAGGAAAGGRQHRRPGRARPPDRRRPAGRRPRRSRSCWRRSTSPSGCATSPGSSPASSRWSSSAPRSSPRCSRRSTRASASSSCASS